MSSSPTLCGITQHMLSRSPRHKCRDSRPGPQHKQELHQGPPGRENLARRNGDQTTQCKNAHFQTAELGTWAPESHRPHECANGLLNNECNHCTVDPIPPTLLRKCFVFSCLSYMLCQLHWHVNGLRMTKWGQECGKGAVRLNYSTYSDHLARAHRFCHRISRSS